MTKKSQAQALQTRRNDRAKTDRAEALSSQDHHGNSMAAAVTSRINSSEIDSSITTLIQANLLDVTHWQNGQWLDWATQFSRFLGNQTTNNFVEAARLGGEYTRFKPAKGLIQRQSEEGSNKEVCQGDWQSSAGGDPLHEAYTRHVTEKYGNKSYAAVDYYLRAPDGTAAKFDHYNPDGNKFFEVKTRHEILLREWSAKWPFVSARLLEQASRQRDVLVKCAKPGWSLIWFFDNLCVSLGARGLLAGIVSEVSYEPWREDLFAIEPICPFTLEPTPEQKIEALLKEKCIEFGDIFRFVNQKAVHLAHKYTTLKQWKGEGRKDILSYIADEVVDALVDQAVEKVLPLFGKMAGPVAAVLDFGDVVQDIYDESSWNQDIEFRYKQIKSDLLKIFARKMSRGNALIEQDLLIRMVNQFDVWYKEVFPEIEKEERRKEAEGHRHEIKPQRQTFGLNLGKLQRNVSLQRLPAVIGKQTEKSSAETESGRDVDIRHRFLDSIDIAIWPLPVGGTLSWISDPFRIWLAPYSNVTNPGITFRSYFVIKPESYLDRRGTSPAMLWPTNEKTGGMYNFLLTGANDFDLSIELHFQDLNPNERFHLTKLVNIKDVRPEQEPELPEEVNVKLGDVMKEVGTQYRVVKGELFVAQTPTEKRVRPEDVDQEYIKTCYFLASLAAVARDHPDALEKMITDNKNGTYTVTFFEDKNWGGKPDYRPVRITVDNKLPFLSTTETKYLSAAPAQISSTGPELWVAIVEKAYAKWKGGYTEIGGGFAVKALPEITGIEATEYKTSDLSEDELLHKLNSALELGHPVVASARSSSREKVFDLFTSIGEEVRKRLNVYYNHAYTLMKADINGRRIVLRNPWGHDDPELPIEIFRDYFKVVTISAL